MTLSFRNGFRYILICVGTTSAFLCGYFVLLSLSRISIVVAAEPSQPLHRTYEAKIESCYRSTAWCPQDHHSSSSSSSSLLGDEHVQQRRWGAYRPGSYFGMKPAVNRPADVLFTGIMWGPSILQGQPLRDQTAQDELTRFDWLRHDGRNFGQQLLIDDAYGIHINASFVVPSNSSSSSGGTKDDAASDNSDDSARQKQQQRRLQESFRQLPAWAQKIVLSPTSDVDSAAAAGEEVARLSDDYRKSFIFYLGTECISSSSGCHHISSMKIKSHSGSAERGYEQAVSLVGHSESSGWFCLFLMVQSLSSSTTFTTTVATAADAAATTNTADATTTAADGSSTASTAVADVDEDAQVSLSYYAYSQSDVLRGKERLKTDAQKAATGQTNHRTTSRSSSNSRGAFNDFGDLRDSSEANAGFAAVHVGFSSAVRIDALFFEHIDVAANDSAVDLHALVAAAVADKTQKLSLLPFFLQPQITAAGEMRKLPAKASESSGEESVVTTKNNSSSSSSSTDVTRVATDVAVDGPSSALVAVAAAAAENVCVTGDCVRGIVDSWLQKFIADFDDKFERIFQLSTKLEKFDDSNNNNNSSKGKGKGDQSNSKAAAKREFSAVQIEAAKVCFSSLLGGMGHFQGSPEIGAAADDVLDDELDSEQAPAVDSTDLKEAMSTALSEQQLQRRPVALFTATPSRTSFPRGFLWDEGYHQMLISQWDTQLSMQVIASWLQAMHFHCSTVDTGSNTGSSFSNTSGGAADVCAASGGWIPREMILGEEGRRRVPKEFITQRVNVANPPTFLLVLESLLDRFTADATATTTADSASFDSSGCGSSSALDTEAVEVTNSSGSDSSGDVTKSEVGAVSCQRVAVDATEQAAVLSFLRDIYPALHAWVQWFFRTQRGSQPDSFRWKGRSQRDGKLIPNTLASGLDDYPRAQIPSAREAHVDLQSWMIRAVGVMHKLETRLATFDGGTYQLPPASLALSAAAAVAGGDYSKKQQRLLQRLDELHWSESLRGYFDVGINDDNATDEIGLFIRCSDERGISSSEVVVPKRRLDNAKQAPHQFCPPAQPVARDLVWRQPNVPKATYMTDTSNATLRHVPRIGYVSLFPFLLKLVPLNSSKFTAVLDVIEDRGHLWTDFGLRSLSAADKYYAKKNAGDDEPYWRGYIWIPINYLALSALHHYTNIPLDSTPQQQQQQQRAMEIYQSLRSNVINNVLLQYERTGFFWEQYDDRSGRGLRGHPFTGWTALIVNIMAEKYI